MLEVRPLLAHEWQILKSVRLAALADAPEAFSARLVEAEVLPNTEWQERARRSETGLNTITFLAYEDGTPCGMLGCFPLETPPLTANLVSFWVSPAFRRQGVGEALIEETVRWSQERGLATMHAWVTNHNARAIAFYERVGFTRTDQIHPYRNDPTKNEVLFVRPL